MPFHFFSQIQCQDTPQCVSLLLQHQLVVSHVRQWGLFSKTVLNKHGPKDWGKNHGSFWHCCCWSIFFCAKSKFKNKSPASNSNWFPISVGLGMCTGPPIHNVLFLTCQWLPKKHPSFYSMPQFWRCTDRNRWSLRQNDPHPTPDPSWVLVDNLNFEALENCFKMNLKSVGRSKWRKSGKKKGGKIWKNMEQWEWMMGVNECLEEILNLGGRDASFESTPKCPGIWNSNCSQERSIRSFFVMVLSS